MCTRSIGMWAMFSSVSTMRERFSRLVSPASSSFTLSSLRLLARLMASLTKVSISAECWRMGASRASAAILSGPSSGGLSRKTGAFSLSFSPLKRLVSTRR
ncbi:hypothetical protein D3C80_1548270 [compost metagenome]